VVSPLFDEKLGGIVGVVVAVKNEFQATELAHLVKHWRAGTRHFRRFGPAKVVLEETFAARRTAWRVFGIRALLIVAVTLFLWFKSGPAVPKELEVELVRTGIQRTRKVTDQLNVTEGEKLRLLITSPAAGYLCIVDREIARDGGLRQPYLAFPNLSTGVGRNKVTQGMVASFPDPSDRSPTIEAKPSQPNDSDYAGEMLTALVYDSQPPIDRLGGAAHSAHTRAVPRRRRPASLQLRRAGAKSGEDDQASRVASPSIAGQANEAMRRIRQCFPHGWA
jgi:hypothetical protein